MGTWNVVLDVSVVEHHTVEADSQEEAEELAIRECSPDAAQINVASIEEVTS